MAMLALGLAALPAALQAQAITFSVIGDVPYDDTEFPVLQQHVVDHNLYSPAEFMVHVGDIFGGGVSCDEYRYQAVADILEPMSVPTLVLPGDNETVDCDDPAQGWTYWTTHFMRFESAFCSKLAFWHQTGREQNIAFVSKGVLFLGIHLVGGTNPSEILQDDADWVEQHLLQQAPFVRASVIFAQAGPGNGDSFFDQFVPDAVTFGKPILYVHGNGHSWIDDMPFGVPNVRRIQVERGTKPPVAITVTADAVPVFLVDRDPFAGSAVNTAPCVNAGTDLGIGIAQQAWLRGQAGDDRDPGSASLALTWSKVSGPGTVTFTSPGTAETYASFSMIGTYVLRLRASDGVLVSTDDVTVTVSTTPPSNNPPVAGFDSYSTLMQRTLTVAAPGVLANDSDPNGTAISAVLVTGPARGVLNLNANGGFTYTPQAGFYGLDGFTYRASDGSLQSSVANVTLNVTPLTLTLTPLEDGTGNSSTPSKASGSSANLRVEADVTSYRSFLKFTVAGAGTTVYRAKLRLFVTNSSPDGGSLYRVSNYFPGTTTAWTEETLTWANMPLIAGTPLGSAGSVDENDWVEFDVTTAIRGDGAYSFGLKNASTNNVEYSSKEGDEAPVLVIETLPGGGGTNVAPVALDNSYTVAEDGSLVLTPPGVLANDTDANGDALTVIQTASPAHGILSLGADGRFTYTPSPNYNGADSFAYIADDDRGGLDPAVVALTVTAVNDAPVAADESYGTNEDVALVVAAPGVRGNDNDIDGDALTVTVVAPPTHGALVLAANGGFTYTPAPDWNGVDTFTYAASDGKGGSDTGAVNLTIAAVEDPPRAADDTYTVSEDQSLTIAAPGLLQNDADPEGDALSTAVATPPSHGTLVLAASGGFTYTPDPNYHGPDSFGYTLSDANGGSDAGNVSLVVSPVNDVPVALDDALATNEDVPLVVAAPGLLANDSDLDADVLVVTLAVAPAHGSVVLAPGGGFIYTPAAHFYGQDSFRYTVNDGNGGTASATVTIAVAAVNDQPDADSDHYATPEDSELVVAAPGVLGNDFDADGDALTVALLSGPARGTLTLAADGSFTYVPSPNDHGIVSFTYTLTDGVGGADSGSATLTVNPVNDPPVAADDMYVLDEDQPLTLAAPGILANDSDVDGDALNASIVVPPAHGTLTLAATGGLSYVPARDFVGTDSFTYRGSDPSDADDTATVTLIVRAVNDLPVATSDTYFSTEDITLAVAAPGVLGNDTDVDGDALVASIVAPPDHGELDLGPDGSFTYTPAPDFNGADGFTYGLSDAKGGIVSGAVAISVAPANDAPVAQDDADTTLEDMPLSRPAPGVLGNDTDIDGDGLTVTVALPPSHGTLVLETNGSYTYTPAVNYHGADSFTYTLRDAQNVTDTGAVALTVVSVNDAPVADTEGYVTSEDVVLTVAAPGVLGNDRDVDGDPLSATLNTSPAHGTLELSTDGGFRYTPAQDFNGTDTFTYRCRDAHNAVDTETVVLYVAPRNDAPVARTDTYATDEDVALAVPAPGLLANDTDVENDALTVSLASPPAHGTAQVTANGSFTYTPAAHYFGADAFTYRLRDPSGATAIGSVTLTVRAVNDAPVAASDAYATDEDTPLIVIAPGLLVNDTDVENEFLSTSVATPPVHGTLVLATNGGYTYTPASHYFGADGFTYTLRDVSGATATGTVALTVRAVNDPPVAYEDSYTTNEDTPLVVAAPGVLSNDDDIENDALSASVLVPPVHGTLVLDANGRFTYSPATDYFGPDAFTYGIRDAYGATGAARVVLTVRAVNDAPVAANDAYTIDEDRPLVVAVPGLLANDSDVENDALSTSIAVPPAHGSVVLGAHGGFTYTPAPHYFGADSFTYTLRDPNGATATGSVALTVRAVNDAPVAANDAYITDEDTPLTVAAPGLLANDTDIETDALTASVAATPTHGTLVLGAQGGFTYTPTPHYFGPDSFTYTLRDPSGATATGSVTLTVRAVNDAPLAANDTYGTDEDTPLTVAAPGLLANDTDIETDALSASVAVPPAHGTLALGAQGGFTYTPSAHYFGADRFTYTLRDPSGATSLGTVDLAVRSVNDPPTAANDSDATDEDTPLAVVAPGLLANDTDVEGDPLLTRLSSPAAHGTVEVGADGSYTYRPSADAFGPDSFTYVVEDDQGGSAVGTVALVVRAVNDPPVVAGETYTIDEDQPLVVDAPGLLANDRDVDGDALSATTTAGPTWGTLQLDASGAVRYTPTPDFHGTDAFTYAVLDNRGGSQSASVTITVRPVNDAPLVVDQRFGTDEDAPLATAAPGLLAAASDVDNDTLAAVLVTPPDHGTLSLAATGGFTYTPAANFFGSDKFTFEVQDGHGGVDAATVTLDVRPTPDAPAVLPDAYTLAEDDRLAVPAPGVLGNDSDVDGDAVVARLGTQAAHGLVHLEMDGSFAYEPVLDFHGTDSFTYVADDAEGGVTSGTVTLTVTPVNDVPLATDDAFGTNEDATLVVPAPGVLGNDLDADGDVWSARLADAPARGVVRLRPDGSFEYQPAADVHGTDAFTYVVDDGHGGVAQGTVQIVVAAVPDAPVATSDAWSLDEDTEQTVPAPGVLGNDTDADGDPLSVRLVTPPAHGTLVLDATGGFRFRPEAHWNGIDTFVYATDDGTGRSAIAPVTLEVRPVNDAPTATQDVYAVDEDGVLARGAPGVLANDGDVDGEVLQALLLTAPEHGTLVLRTDGGFTYTPAADFNGDDLFVYTARDAGGLNTAAVVRLDITAVNDAPRPTDDAYSVSEDDTLVVAAPGPLGNDIDVEGEALTAALSAPPTHGSVTMTTDGGFRYTPAVNFSGDDGFTYRVQDTSGGTTLAAVLLRVEPVNDAPHAGADSFVVQAGQATTIAAPGLLGNDTDADGDSLRTEVATGPQFGQLELDTHGAFVYTPLPGFTGPDAFTYRVDDGQATDVTTVTLHVEGHGVTYRESVACAHAAPLELATDRPLVAAAGDLYLAALSTQPFRPAARVSGMNLTWTRVRSQCGVHGETGVELWMACGSPSPGIVTASFDTPADHAVLAVSRYSGVDPLDPLGMQVGSNSSGLEADCSGGPEGTDYAWRMTTLTQGGILYRAVARRDRTHTATDGAFRRQTAAQGESQATASLDVEDRAVDAGDHELRGSLSPAVDWAALAVEIRSARIDDTRRFAETLHVFPNPFANRTLVQFTLYRRAVVDIQIFDVRGRLVRRLLNEARPPGRLQLDWNATDARGRTLDSGVYFLRLQSEGNTVTRKVVLLK